MICVGFVEKSKRTVFRWIRAIPIVQREFQKEHSKVKKTIEEDMNKPTAGLAIYNHLPLDGRSPDKVLEEAKVYLNLGNYNVNH